MTEHLDEASRPRPHIIDTNGPEFTYSPQPRGKRRRRRGGATRQEAPHNDQQGDGDLAVKLQRQWPLEAMDIQRAIVGYGRRTAALGALQGAHALSTLVNRIRGLNLGQAIHPALEQIVNDADAEASRLRTMLDQVYEDDI